MAGPITFGPNALPVRKVLGVSQADFAKLIGTTQVTVCKWEMDVDPPQPTGCAKAVLLGLEMALKSSGNAPQMISFINDHNKVGGLAFLLLRLLEQVPFERSNETAPPNPV